MDRESAAKNKSQSEVEDLNRKMKDLATKNRDFVAVYASSGHRSVRAEKTSTDGRTGRKLPPTPGKAIYRFALDWSLSELAPTRGMLNRVPEHPPIPVRERPRSLSSEQRCEEWTVLGGKKKEENQNVNPWADDVNVGKFGRTTGFTYGQLDSLPVLIDPETENPRHGKFTKMAQKYNFTVADYGCVYAVISHKPGGVFVEGGDSGSVLVHAPSGTWLGLIFGEAKSGNALFTPIDLVFRDIEQVTGYAVVEPRFTPNI